MARLIAAIKAMDIDAVEEILDGTADPEAPLPEPGRYHVMSFGGSPLHACVSLAEPGLWETPTVGNGNYKLILYRLLESGADMNAVDNDGLTPLHWACKLGNKWAISLLLNLGASVHATDHSGNTPLHQLVHATQLTPQPKLGGAVTGKEMLQWLLNRGADPTVPRHDGLRPYDLLSPMAPYGPLAVHAYRNGGSAGNKKLAKDTGRWDADDFNYINDLAIALDQKRHQTVAGVRMILLWRHRSSEHPISALPEELLHSQIFLRACGDSGLKALWERSFAEIAQHASLEVRFRRKAADLAEWLQRPSEDESLREETLTRMNDDYDEATAEVARLRKGGQSATCQFTRSKALQALKTFANAAHKVLYDVR